MPQIDSPALKHNANVLLLYTCAIRFLVSQILYVKTSCSVVMVLESEDSSEQVFEKLPDHGFSDKVAYEIWYWYHHDTVNIKR